MKYTIFLLLIVSLCSCENEFLGIGEEKAADYMPLQIGNYWIYNQPVTDGS